MSAVNYVDLLILAIFALSIFTGFYRGFAREIIALITIIAAIALAILYAHPVASHLMNLAFVQNFLSSHQVGEGDQSISYLAVGVAFFLIFVFVMLIGSIVGFLLSAIFSLGLFGIVNRFFGALFGVIRGALWVLLMIMIVQLTAFKEQPAWQNSKLIPYFEPVATWLSDAAAPYVTEVKNKVSKSLQKKKEKENKEKNVTKKTSD